VTGTDTIHPRAMKRKRLDINLRFNTFSTYIWHETESDTAVMFEGIAAILYSRLWPDVTSDIVCKPEKV